MKVINPATEVSEHLEETSLEHIPTRVDLARQQQPAWGEYPLEMRVAILSKWPELVEAKRNHIAHYMTQDMGKPLANSQKEIDATLAHYQFFCRQATDWLGSEDAPGGYIQYDPLGVVAVIAPWNGPFIVPMLSILPALLAGNSVVFKPSENALRTGIEIGRLTDTLAGLPDGLVQTIVGGKKHGEILVEQDVDLVAFTGSGAAGKDIMRHCASKLTRVLLELGGLDAAIVLKDADIALTAERLVRNNCYNTGQICCAVKRVYVEKEVYEDFIQAASQESKRISYGDPTTNVDMGPLVAKFQLDKVQATVIDAREKGATFLTGGERPSTPGYFFPSTIVTNVHHRMKIMTEEPFGPLLPIFPVDSWEEAVQLANDTRYGLSGSVWTRNSVLGKEILTKLEVGVAGLNTHGAGQPGAPFGGAKESGLGRIKTKEGFRAYTNTKMVRVE